MCKVKKKKKEIVESNVNNYRHLKAFASELQASENCGSLEEIVQKDSREGEMYRRTKGHTDNSRAAAFSPAATGAQSESERTHTF